MKTYLLGVDSDVPKGVHSHYDVPNVCLKRAKISITASQSSSIRSDMIRIDLYALRYTNESGVNSFCLYKGSVLNSDDFYLSILFTIA